MPHSSPSSWDADPPLSSPTSPDSGARDGRDSRSDGGSLLAPAPASLLSCCSPASVVSQQRWSRCADLTLYLSYAFILLIAAVSLYALITRREGLDTLAYALGLISLFLALPISLYDIHSHVANYVSPLQMRYIRILAMIPLYSVESWLALFFRQQRVGLELARELYEAFVIYNTFMLMVDFLGGADRTQALLRTHGVYAKHIFCLQRLGLKGWHVDNGEFYRRCFLCVLQYVLVRCLLAVLTAALSAGSRDLYCEGVWDWGACAYPHFTLLLTLSQFAAIYGLFLFRHELAVELQPINPWPKLLCVKVIVFATFWLQAGLHIAQLVGGIRPSGSFSAEDVTAGVANLSVCIMCAGVAVGHHLCFGLKEFRSLDTLVPQNSPVFSLTEVVAAVLPTPKDVVDVPLAVVREGLRVMTGAGKTASSSSGSSSSSGGSGGGTGIAAEYGPQGSVPVRVVLGAAGGKLDDTDDGIEEEEGEGETGQGEALEEEEPPRRREAGVGV